MSGAWDGLLAAASLTAHRTHVLFPHPLFSPAFCPILQQAMTLWWVLVAGAPACKYLIGFQYHRKVLVADVVFETKPSSIAADAVCEYWGAI